MVPPRPNETDPGEHRRPTLKDVAKRAGGVHPSTVSLAMRNHPGISEALRKRIKAAAAEVGYRPDPLLDAFNTHRVAVQSKRAHSVIAWVAAAPDRSSVFSDPYLCALWEGAKEAAEYFHCQLELFLVGPGQLTPGRLNTVLRTRGITGVILVRLPSTLTEVSLSWEFFCAVRIESLHLPLPRYVVTPDHRQAFRFAWRRLQGQGATRIGFALGASVEPEVARQLTMSHDFELTLVAKSRRLDRASVSRPEDALRWADGARADALVVAGLPGDDDSWRKARLPVVSLDGPSAPSLLDAFTCDGHAIGTQAVEQTVMLMRTNQRGHPRSVATTFLPFHWRPAASEPIKELPATRTLLRS